MERIISPLFLGLSTGSYCFVYCLPFLAPLMVMEERKRKENFFFLVKFILGRLFGYLSFGAFVGFLAEKIKSEFLNLILFSALLILSLILILHSASFLKEKNNFCNKTKKISPKIPFFVGFFSGINLCPPFLISTINVFVLKGVLVGALYFFFFFLGTSLYFLPLFFFGFLGKYKEFQIVGRISGLFAGIFFFLYSLYSILRGANYIHFNL